MSTPVKISTSNVLTAEGPSDLKATSSASAPEVNIRIRYYRHSDALQVRWLFTNSIGVGAKSPLHVAVRAQFRRPIAFVFYSTIIVGLFLSIWPSMWPSMLPEVIRTFGGPLLVLISILVAVKSMLNLRTAFRAFMDGAFYGDLNDVPTVYGMVNIYEKDGEELSPIGRNAFWVAETYGDGVRSEIVGCVGIDVNTNSDKTSAELRRMAVSSAIRRKGIARLLIREAIAHARRHQIASVYLKTSSWSTIAVTMYQRLGWHITAEFASYPEYRGMYITEFDLDVATSTL